MGACGKHASFSPITCTQCCGKNPTWKPRLPLHQIDSPGLAISMTDIISPTSRFNSSRACTNHVENVRKIIVMRITTLYYCNFSMSWILINRCLIGVCYWAEHATIYIIYLVTSFNLIFHFKWHIDVYIWNVTLTYHTI